MSNAHVAPETNGATVKLDQRHRGPGQRRVDPVVDAFYISTVTTAEAIFFDDHTIIFFSVG
jgi:hypothetical protein